MPTGIEHAAPYAASRCAPEGHRRCRASVLRQPSTLHASRLRSSLTHCRVSGPRRVQVRRRSSSAAGRSPTPPRVHACTCVALRSVGATRATDAAAPSSAMRLALLQPPLRALAPAEHSCSQAAPRCAPSATVRSQRHRLICCGTRLPAACAVASPRRCSGYPAQRSRGRPGVLPLQRPPPPPAPTPRSSPLWPSLRLRALSSVFATLPPTSS